MTSDQLARLRLCVRPECHYAPAKDDLAALLAAYDKCEAALREYEDRRNWRSVLGNNGGTRDLWDGHGKGDDLARNALSGQED